MTQSLTEKVKKEFFENIKVDRSGLGMWAGSSTGGVAHYDFEKIWDFISHALSQARDEERKRTVDELNTYLSDQIARTDHYLTREKRSVLVDVKALLRLFLSTLSQERKNEI